MTNDGVCVTVDKHTVQCPSNELQTAFKMVISQMCECVFLSYIKIWKEFNVPI